MSARALKRIAQHSPKSLTLPCEECRGKASIKVRLKGGGRTLWLCAACIVPLGRDLMDYAYHRREAVPDAE